MDEITAEGPSFRALSRMTGRQRDQAVAAGVLGTFLSDWIDERFGLPEPNIPEYMVATPEAAAMGVRTEWGLGERPVSNMVHLLEFHGVQVFSLSEESREVDAYSFWRDRTPFVFLNTRWSAERSRMDAAHELGHLVLHHKGGSQRSRQAEQEAQQFGSSFLMPSGSVLARMRPGAEMAMSGVVRRLVDRVVVADALVGSPIVCEVELRRVLDRVKTQFRQNFPRRGPRHSRRCPGHLRWSPLDRPGSRRRRTLGTDAR